MGFIKIFAYYFPSVFFLSFVSTMYLDNHSILNLIKLDKSSNCYKETLGLDLLHNLDLNEIPEFGAMCNVPLPNPKQMTFLLENNVTPILCMGILDVFQRFCKLAKQNSQVTQYFPLTVEETDKLFRSFEKSQPFSSLPVFCSSTVANVTLTQSENVWWSELRQQFKNEHECSNLCRINDQSKVNPLCSYIIWFNSLNQSSFGTDSQVPLSEDANVERNPSEELNEVPLDSNQIRSSSVPMQTSSLSLTTEHSTSTTVNVKDQSATAQARIPVPETKITDKQQQENLQNNTNLTRLVSTNEKTESIANLKFQSQDINSTGHNDAKVVFPIKTIGKETHSIADTGKNSSSASKLGNINVKEEDGYNSKTTVNKSVIHDLKKTVKPADRMVETDFSLEMTPDGMEIEQPDLADKNLQQPFSDEELENGDGDDIDFEPEGSLKSGQNKTVWNKSKSSPASVDEGVNDSDKVYGEEREILIEDHFIEAEDSHFFTYFLCMAVLTIMAYLAFHNKKKLVALALEGKRTRSSRRRPNTSNYSKLDCSLEEAMTSSRTPASTTHVLY